ncbi:tyrosine-protein kinase receptor Tie-1-like [Actinia tenebrosa]|uniref:Tyrosine-protein kinase receptor Tie-1-like n=1 Tax=Actinia tenebrosa TaxID=6105 RepID=A0A6P8HX60_ACTTE|nr:tyrosine-protein kinase receptor Tie-1-like [Actinia tenebrosa]
MYGWEWMDGNGWMELRSFSIMFIYPGGRPYAGMNGLEVVEMIKNGKRLSKPPHVYSKLYSLMLQCWSKNPNHRPDFTSLCKQITLLAKDHQRYLNLKEYDHRLYVNVSSLEET